MSLDDDDVRADSDHGDIAPPQVCDLEQNLPVPAEAVQGDLEDNDIYRGDAPPEPRSPSPESSVLASSSGSFLSRGRLGAIALVVELAITRWARRSSSPSSSSSSSSRSSINTASQSRFARRRKQGPSTGNLQSAQSERDIVARIKARAESRRIPREFTLYVPPTPGHPHPRTQQDDPQAHSRISRTTSLPLILGQLTTALKAPARARRHQDCIATQKQDGTPRSTPILHHSPVLPDHIKAPSRAASFTEISEPPKGRKGKERQAGQPQTSSMNRAFPLENSDSHRHLKAWWLDVASPSWEDMRAIGKVSPYILLGIVTSNMQIYTSFYIFTL
jgi:magnesium transporter